MIDTHGNVTIQMIFDLHWNFNTALQWNVKTKIDLHHSNIITVD